MPGGKSSKTKSDLNIKYARLCNDKTKLQTQISQLENSITIKDSTIASLKSKILSLNQQNLNIKTSMKQLQQSLNKQSKRIKLLNDQLHQKEHEWLIIKNKLVDMELIDKIILKCNEIIDEEILSTTCTLNHKLIIYTVL